MSTYHPPDLMSSGSNPADYCWAMSDWYRDRGDLTRAQEWANAAQLAEEFEDNARMVGAAAGRTRCRVRENAQQTEERMMLAICQAEAEAAGDA